ncbi:hypothetical protein BHE74_00058496 [Ensete ventricosum]|nr:hypothetical protein BHE74_00058496 [Ensete ventricosum]
MRAVGGRPYGRRRCPWAAPHGRASAEPACGTSVDVTPLRAGRMRALPLRPGHGRALPLRPDHGRCSGISPKFARRFAEGIGKLVGNTLRDCRKKTGRLTVRMPEAAGLAEVQARIRKVEGTTFAEISIGKPSVSGGCTAATQVFGQLTTADPPRADG